MNNKQGKSNLLGLIAGALIVIVVILFRVYRAVGPEQFGIESILKYLGEVAVFVAAWAGCSFVGKSEKIKSPFSGILIALIIVAGLFFIYKLWRL